MPIEPPPSPWVLPDLSDLPQGQELVAVGADLAPGTLLAGYRSGLFAMPDNGILGWWSPDPRGILPPDRVHVSRSLRRSLTRFEVSVDVAFDAVVAACADPARPHGWISPPYQAAYRALHSLGWAHSVEVWDTEGQLAGGLFGVEVGGLFASESKFHIRSDASKVAVVALADLLVRDGDPRRVIDVQWSTEHLASLGCVQVSRRDYLDALPWVLSAPPALAGRPSGEPGPGPSRIRWRRA